MTQISTLYLTQKVLNSQGLVVHKDFYNYDQTKSIEISAVTPHDCGFVAKTCLGDPAADKT